MPRRSDESNFSESLHFFRDRTLRLPRRAATIQTDLIFQLCDLLQRQNSIVETKIYKKIFQIVSDMKQFTATWCSDMSFSVYRPTSNTNEK